MAGIGTPSSDLNVNRPVIWPSGKPSGQISRGSTPAEGIGGTAQMGQVKGGVSQRQPLTLSPQAAAALAQLPVAAATGEAILQAFPLLKGLINQPYTMQHLVNILLALGLNATSENIALAAKIIQNGINLTKENLNFVKAAVLFARGVNPNVSQDASMILLSRGLNNFSAAFNALIAFMGENPQLGEQMTSLQALLVSLQESLNRGQNLSADLLSQLAALIQNWEGTPEKISKNQLNRENLVNNVRSLKALFSGLAGQIGKTSAATNQGQTNQLAQAGQQIEQLLQNLVAAAILSLPKVNTDTAFPNYYYAQVPNVAGGVPINVEIMIKRDETNAKKKINPKKTVIIVGLEALVLGKIIIEMSVEERNIDFHFKTALDETNSLIRENMVNLKGRLETEGFTARKVEVVTLPVEQVDIKKYLFPMINLGELRRIITEA